MAPQTAINKSRGLNAATCNQMAEQHVDMLTTELQCSSWGSITHSLSNTHHGNIVGETGDGARVRGLRGSVGLVVDLRSLVTSASVSERFNDCSFVWNMQTAASSSPLLTSMNQHLKTTELTELITGRQREKGACEREND